MEKTITQQLLKYSEMLRSNASSSSVGGSSGSGVGGTSSLAEVQDVFNNILRRRLESYAACGSPNNQDDPIVQGFKFWGAGVTISAVGGFGLIGNLISFLTIISMKRRSLFNNLLLTLTLFDILFIINGGLFFVQRSFKFQSEAYNVLFPKVIYPLAGISMTGSTYTCIAIALERFLGICYSQSDFLIRRSRFYIWAILLISVLIDFPRFFEINRKLVKGEFVDFEYSELRNNHTYVTVYTLWFRLIATAALPFLLTLFFNLKILVYYKRNSFTFGQLNHSSSSPPQQPATPFGGGGRISPRLLFLQHQVSTTSSIAVGASNPAAAAAAVVSASGSTGLQSTQERSLFITFFCLTVTFLVCHLPRILMNINELHMNQQRQICRTVYKTSYVDPNWVLVASSIEKVLLILNSSINFVYYCLVGKTFRQHMCRSLFWWCGWCLRVVTGTDAATTTTAGTGDTTVPDLNVSFACKAAGGGGTSRKVSCDLESMDGHEWFPDVGTRRVSAVSTSGSGRGLARMCAPASSSVCKFSSDLNVLDEIKEDDDKEMISPKGRHDQGSIGSSCSSSLGYFEINIRLGEGDSRQSFSVCQQERSRSCLPTRNKPGKWSSSAVSSLSPTGSFCEGAAAAVPVFV